METSVRFPMAFKQEPFVDFVRPTGFPDMQTPEGPGRIPSSSSSSFPTSPSSGPCLPNAKVSTLEHTASSPVDLNPTDPCKTHSPLNSFVVYPNLNLPTDYLMSVDPRDPAMAHSFTSSEAVHSQPMYYPEATGNAYPGDTIGMVHPMPDNNGGQTAPSLAAVQISSPETQQTQLLSRVNASVPLVQTYGLMSSSSLVSGHSGTNQTKSPDAALLTTSHAFLVSRKTSQNSLGPEACRQARTSTVQQTMSSNRTNGGTNARRHPSLAGRAVLQKCFKEPVGRQSSKAHSHSSLCSRASYMCRKCKTHGQNIPVKRHKRACPYMNCSCLKCHLVDQGRKVVAKQIALYRDQKGQPVNREQKNTGSHLEKSVPSSSCSSFLTGAAEPSVPAVVCGRNRSTGGWENSFPRARKRPVPFGGGPPEPVGSTDDTKSPLSLVAGGSSLGNYSADWITTENGKHKFGGIVGPYCRRCRNHSLAVTWKGHKKTCPYRNCPCDPCRLINVRKDTEKTLREMVNHNTGKPTTATGGEVNDQQPTDSASPHPIASMRSPLTHGVGSHLSQLVSGSLASNRLVTLRSENDEHRGQPSGVAPRDEDEEHAHSEFPNERRQTLRNSCIWPPHPQLYSPMASKGSGDSTWAAAAGGDRPWLPTIPWSPWGRAGFQSNRDPDWLIQPSVPFHTGDSPLAQHYHLRPLVDKEPTHPQGLQSYQRIPSWPRAAEESLFPSVGERHSQSEKRTDTEESSLAYGLRVRDWYNTVNGGGGIYIPTGEPQLPEHDGFYAGQPGGEGETEKSREAAEMDLSGLDSHLGSSELYTQSTEKHKPGRPYTTGQHWNTIINNNNSSSSSNNNNLDCSDRKSRSLNSGNFGLCFNPDPPADSTFYCPGRVSAVAAVAAAAAMAAMTPTIGSPSRRRCQQHVHHNYYPHVHCQACHHGPSAFPESPSFDQFCRGKPGHLMNCSGEPVDYWDPRPNACFASHLGEPGDGARGLFEPPTPEAQEDGRSLQQSFRTGHQHHHGRLATIPTKLEDENRQWSEAPQQQQSLALFDGYPDQHMASLSPRVAHKSDWRTSGTNSHGIYASDPQGSLGQFCHRSHLQATFPFNSPSPSSAANPTGNLSNPYAVEPYLATSLKQVLQQSTFPPPPPQCDTSPAGLEQRQPTTARQYFTRTPVESGEAKLELPCGSSPELPTHYQNNTMLNCQETNGGVQPAADSCVGGNNNNESATSTKLIDQTFPSTQNSPSTFKLGVSAKQREHTEPPQPENRSELTVNHDRYLDNYERLLSVS